MDWLDTLKFDDNGLMPAVAQDFHTGRILMMAWMNRESLRLTAEKCKLCIGHALAVNYGTKAKALGIFSKSMKSV